MSSYLVPNVITTSARGERIMDVYSHLLNERIVYLGTAIDDGVANAVVAQLLHLNAQNPDSEINLYLNSPGGSMTAMFAIYDTMQFVAADVSTTCIGQAASSAAILLAAGAPGRRFVLPHSRVLLHQPSANGQGTIPDLILAAGIQNMSQIPISSAMIVGEQFGFDRGDIRIGERIVVGGTARLQEVRLAGAAFAPEQQRRFTIIRGQPVCKAGERLPIASGNEVVEAGRGFRQEVEEQLAHVRESPGRGAGST